MPPNFVDISNCRNLEISTAATGISKAANRYYDSGDQILNYDFFPIFLKYAIKRQIFLRRKREQQKDKRSETCGKFADSGRA